MDRRKASNNGVLGGSAFLPSFIFFFSACKAVVGWLSLHMVTGWLGDGGGWHCDFVLMNVWGGLVSIAELSNGK